MKRYIVSYDVQASVTLTVEAEDEVGATDRADDIIHSMSNDDLARALDIGDTDLMLVEEAEHG